MSDNALTPRTDLVPLFVVDTPPYMRSGTTLHTMSRDTVLALVPAAVCAFFAFGLAPLRVMALAAGTAILVEALCQRMAGRDIRIHDGTALVTGLLFAFLLPAGAPWWLAVIGAALTMALGKHVFGGLGCNPLCPPLVGWAAMTISWPTQMDPGAMTLNTQFIDPLLRLKYFGPASLPAGSDLSLLLGQQLGGLGSAQVAAVLAGGLFLLARRLIRWEIPLSFLLGVLIVGGIYWHVDPQVHVAPHLYFLTGSTIFAAFFLATDHPSSPVGSVGMALYGLLGGALVVLIRVYGIYPDSAPFAVLLASLLTPAFDMIRPAPYGKRS